MHEITNSGWIEVVTGCMFSGKTEEVMRRLRRAEIAEKDTTAFTAAVDDRYGEESLGSHAGRNWEATVVNTGDPEAILDLVSDEDVVAIDEANFFDDELCEVCQTLARNGHRVIVSGTDQTFRGEPFSPLPSLMAVAEYVDKMTAICAVCGDPASRNQRLVDGNPAPVDDPTIKVGGNDDYEPRCRDCHRVSGE